MSRIGRPILENACYHIITRGNQKQNIFIKDKDYREYLNRVRYYKNEYKFRLYGYCLMPNHVHMVGEIEKAKNLSKFMHGINRSYTAYFNDTYDKVGHLWQGRFKSKIIVKDRYLFDCINYVETNPIRAAICTAPYEYKWSSYAIRVLEIEKRGCLLDRLKI
ncbi:MAG: transposase [Candidatus Omnitrophica bacterium]|nr:transposase [Candidatus Omnitrophota bacterium]